MSPSSLALQSALTGVARRLRWRRTLAVGALALACLFSVGIVAVVLDAILAPTALAGWPRIAGGWMAVGIVLFCVSNLRRAVSDDAAAAHADAASALHDELKSSLWFSRSPEASSPWVQAHLDRAAATASKLDPVGVVPLGMPAAGWPAVGLGVGFALALAFAPLLTPTFHERAHENAGPVAKSLPERRDVDQLVADMERSGDAVAKARLKEALAALDDPHRSAAEKRRAIEAARELAARRALEAAAGAEKLRDLAESLAGRKGMEQVADALRQGDARGAAEALRSQLERAEGAANEESGQGAARPPVEAQALADALKESAQPGTEEPPPGEATGATDGTLAKAVQNLEEIARRIDASAALNQAARKLSQMSTALNRQSDRNLRAARFGRQQGNAGATGAPETGEADIRGGHMFRLGAVAQDRKQGATQEKARAGDASGNAKGDPVVGDEVSRIKAKLKRESVKGGDDDASEGTDSAFYAASRQGDVKVAYQAVETRYRQAGEEALGVERIALRDRARVRQYFSDSTETPK